MTDWQTDLLREFQLGLTPPDNRPIYDWARDYVSLHSAYSIPGNFDINRSRYLIEPFAALKDINVRQVNIMASPRCAKTLCAEIFLLHTLANSAGTFAWIQSTDEMASKMGSLRMIPLLKNCPPVKQMIPDMSKFVINIRKFTFPHMSVFLSGAKIKALQSIGYKYLIGDEVWLWDQGFIGEAKSRTIDFQHTSKILFLSQGGMAGDDWTTEFNKYPIYEWGFICPKCNKEQVYSWNKVREDGTYAGITWTKDKLTKPDGQWDYQAAAKTARLSCFYCKHEITDNPQNRRYLNDHGVYINTSTKGDLKRKSFRWNALANIEIQFGDLVIEYLQAKDILTREGNMLPMQEFYQKRMATSFNNDMSIPIHKILLSEYNPSELWGDHRFMTIDCQQDFAVFYYIIRSWNKSGESRLIKYGKATSWIDLRKIQQANGIKDQCVLIDSGYQATQVYQKCVEYSHVGVVNKKKVLLSWIALKGYDTRDFKHLDNSNRLYSPETRGDPASGKCVKGATCPMYRWSNRSIKDILFHLRDGKGASWLANEVDDDYTRQLNSEILTQELDKKSGRTVWRYVQKAGVPNHFLDCEAMHIVGSCMVGILGGDYTKDKEVLDKTI